MADDAPLLTATRGPFTGGYTSSVPAFMAREDQLWGEQDGSETVSGLPVSSRDCFIDPFTGGVSKRSGCAIAGDTSSNGVEVSGLLGAKWGARARKFFALDSPSMTDNYPIRSVLYGEDTNAGFPTADSGFPGTLYMRSTNSSGFNRQLLKEFGSTHYLGTYNGASVATDYKLRMVPIQIESGDGVYNRGALTGTAGTDTFMQQYLTCGSRSAVQTQNWLYFPNLRATPWRWNKRFNDSSGGGSEIFRGFPTGPFGPLYPPTVAVGSTSTTNASWEAGDTFFISVAFQFEDGSYSLPFIPRGINDILASGNGLVTVGTPASGVKYTFLTYSNIPLGPEGTVSRVILRTPKQNRTATTETITVAPLDLRVVAVLRNNTQTSFLDYGGDDDNLVEDNDVVRLDLVCPKRARYAGTGDQRMLVSYTLPNTAAIMLAPTGSVVSRDKNLADTADALYGTAAYMVRITSTDLELHFNTGVVPDYTASSGNAHKFSLATYDTIEKMVDAINTTGVSVASGNEAKQWAAQLAPGIDGSMPTASLTKTTMDIACGTTVSTTVTSSALFGPVGVGMKVSGTGITAGTYVVSKASASSLTISTAASGIASPTLTFYQETGDNAVVTGGTLGYIRAFSSTFPVLLHMKPSAFPKYDKPDKSSVFYTMASPGALSSGVSLAPNNFLAGNKLTTHSSPRQQMQRACMGIVDIEGAAVVAFTDGIHMFTNKRGGNTGEDFDYRLFTINDGRGCISYLGLVAGNGWAAYPTTEGIIATDKSGREFTISGDVFNPSDNKGDLAYEILTSAASAASDSDDQYLSCAVIGSQLAVGFRTSTSADPRVLFYDFSPGVEASGIEELLNPETKRAYIWSPPAIYNNTRSLGSIGAMGSVRNASGRLDYICYDSNLGTGDGRIDQINTGTTDPDAASVTSYALPAPFVSSPFKGMLPQRIMATHLTTSGAATIYFANNQIPTLNTSSDYARVLNVDANRTQLQRQVIPIALGQRGRTDMLWAQWRSSSAVTVNRLWEVVLQYAEADMDVGAADLV